MCADLIAYLGCLSLSVDVSFFLHIMCESKGNTNLCTQPGLSMISFRLVCLIRRDTHLKKSTELWLIILSFPNKVKALSFEEVTSFPLAWESGFLVPTTRKLPGLFDLPPPHLLASPYTGAHSGKFPTSWTCSGGAFPGKFALRRYSAFQRLLL